MNDSEPKFLLGIDVGSTTIKAVAVDLRTDDIVWRDYQRHESRPGRAAARDADPDRDGDRRRPRRCRAFMTGSSGAAYADLVGAHYVQEVAAVALAVERRHPDARTVIELGGQDAKISSSRRRWRRPRARSCR